MACLRERAHMRFNYRTGVTARVLIQLVCSVEITNLADTRKRVT